MDDTAASADRRDFIRATTATGLGLMLGAVL
jgi:hypothetical protein